MWWTLQPNGKESACLHNVQTLNTHTHTLMKMRHSHDYWSKVQSTSTRLKQLTLGVYVQRHRSLFFNCVYLLQQYENISFFLYLVLTSVKCLDVGIASGFPVGIQYPVMWPIGPAGNCCRISVISPSRSIQRFVFLGYPVRNLSGTLAVLSCFVWLFLESVPANIGLLTSSVPRSVPSK
jgi:hypothetical protein